KKGKKPNNAEYKKLQHILYAMRTTLLGYMIRFETFHNITSYPFYLKRFQFMYSRKHAYPNFFPQYIKVHSHYQIMSPSDDDLVRDTRRIPVSIQQMVTGTKQTRYLNNILQYSGRDGRHYPL